MTDNRIDISSLRLPQNFGANLGVRKVLTTVRVHKPRPDTYFRVHPTVFFDAYVYEDKESREKYLVVPEVVGEINLARASRLFLAVDSKGNPFLVPVPLPREDGTHHPAHEALTRAVDQAKTSWIRTSWNQSINGYDVYEARGQLTDPSWPEEPLEKLIELGFRGKIIDSPDHPIARKLQGFE